ncbi:hypothetical protein JNUCC42_04490 [Brevibacterium sp. JNUCC-42]|nr:hypothetical protein JNUCC42_04490 [Brevibacterium sp. JNUCC-42]
MKAITNNPHFKLGTTTQNTVVSALSNLIGNATVDA